VTPTKEDINHLIGPKDMLRLSRRQHQIMHLLAGRKEMVTAEAMCAALGIGPQVFRTHLYQLRANLWPRGYDIENVRGEGYRLVRTGVAE
jgi:predicted DNA-binding transcriptional regulator YafY